MAASKSQVWFITGSSSNFGLALVRACLGAGHRVIATARRPTQLQQSLPSSDALLVVGLDVTRPEQIDTVFAAAIDCFGRVDVVVNKSGYEVIGELEAVPEDDARACFETVFWGPVAVNKKAVKIFREVNPPGAGGRIINITGPMALTTPPAAGITAAGKAALEAVTLSLTRELPKEWNITAVNVEPGMFEDEILPGAVKMVSQSAAYANAAPGSGAAFMRQFLGTTPPPVSSADKMARALLTLAQAEKVPMRVPLGSDAWAYTCGVARKMVQELEEAEDMAQQTDRDGIDSGAVKAAALQAVSSLL